MSAPTSSWNDLKNNIKTNTTSKDMKIDGVLYDPEISSEEKLDDIFSKRDDNKKIHDYELYGIKGRSSSGKTRTALSFAKCVDELIYKEINKPEAKYVLDLISNGSIPQFSPVYIMGTEESTQKEIYAVSNVDYYSNTDIRFLEINEYTDGLLDHKKTYNNFLKNLKRFLVNKPKGTLVIDSFSFILYCMHEIIRREVMAIPELKKEQGVPAKYWFWRNTNCEMIMLLLRRLPMHKVLTYKITKGREIEDEIEWKTRWHEDTNYHLSDTVVENTLRELNNEAYFTSKIEKCRNNKSLIHKEFKNLNGSKLIYEMYKK